jgi:hypothetical protein
MGSMGHPCITGSDSAYIMYMKTQNEINMSLICKVMMIRGFNFIIYKLNY